MKNSKPEAIARERVKAFEKHRDRIFKRIRNTPGLSEDEAHLFARSLAATPDERWRLHENFLRMHGLFKRSSRKKFGFK